MVDAINRRTYVSYRNGRAAAGFTLIEVLIALALLSVAGIALVEAHLGSMHLWGRYRESVVVRQLLQQKMAEAEAEGFSGNKQGEGEFEGPYAGYRWEIESSSVGESALYEIVCTVVTPTNREYTLTYVYYDFT